MTTSVSPGEPRLTGTRWSIRLGRARHGRTALEIYDGESLTDIVAPTSVAPRPPAGHPPADFDVTTASPGPQRMTAIAMTVFLEAPITLLCVALTVRTFPRRGS